MAKYDEIPRGQLSSIILMCLVDKDKYGYEIIDEVLSKTNGRMSIKQPSLYSSLKRMEEQSLISSYWRDSEIGGRRHYYHLTDLGKKNLEKWQENFSFSDFANSSTQEQETKILQQTNLFSIKPDSTNQVAENKTAAEAEKNDSFIQFDLFSNRTIVTPPTEEILPQVSYALPSATNIPEGIEQKPIVTEYEKPEELSNVKKFEYIKKINKSFAEKVKSTNSIEDRKFVEQNNLILDDKAQRTSSQPSTTQFTSVAQSHTGNIQSSNFLENLNKDEDIENANTNPSELDISEIPNNLEREIDCSTNFVENLKNNDEDYMDNNTDIISTTDNNVVSKKISVSNLPGYTAKNNELNNVLFEPKDDCVYLPQQKNTEHEYQTSVQPLTDINNSTKNKDDGVIITERLELKDIPKQPKFEARKFEVYISDDSLRPKLQKNTTNNYEDRIKDLYEKSKSNAENHELEIIDSKIKFSSYKQLEEFYSEQKIKFKPYKKSLRNTGKNFDMIKINKLNMLTSLSLFAIYSTLSAILGIVLTSIKNINTTFPLIFASIPIILLIVFIVSLTLYERSPQKRIAYDINKFKFNFSSFAISIAITPLVIALNMIFGFNFTNFNIYAATIIYPSTLSLVYILYYATQKILVKSKSMY